MAKVLNVLNISSLQVPSKPSLKDMENLLVKS